MGRSGRGGGGGGGGGGGRSSGGGGGRSFGGRSSSSSRSGYGSSSNGYRSSSSSFNSSYSSRPRQSAPSYYNSPRYTHYQRSYAPGVMNPRPIRYLRPPSVLRTIKNIFIIILLMVVLLVGLQAGFQGNITKSTVKREPLEKGLVIETAYYTDELGWIDNSTKLETGMRNFYNKTGIQPHLYIAEDINGNYNPTESQIEKWMNDTYDRLFRDEAHFLLLFLEYNEEYSMWYCGGSQTKVLMDKEASNILMDYVDAGYYSDLSDSELFSQAFDKTATRIMTVTKSPWVLPVVLFGIIVILFVIMQFWTAAKKQANIEAEQNERILNTPLETFGPETSPLEEKYRE